MVTFQLFSIFFGIFGMTCGQFPNPFSMSAMNTGTSSSGNGTSCAQTISCAPWCSRSLDANQCVVCHCNTGGSCPSPQVQMRKQPVVCREIGMNPMGGANPMSMMGPMNGGPNPLVAMFSGLTGGMSPMTGGIQKQGSSCPPAPTTCPVPQPWCERITDSNGCIKCLCGNELVAYIQTLNGHSTSTSQKPAASGALTSTSQPLTSTTTVPTTPVPTTSRPHSCIDDFYCTKLCDNGYQTDAAGCPVCECLSGILIDTPVNATDPPGKFIRSTTTTTASHAPIVTDPVTSCPGIFDCPIICNNGYKTDSQGCPLCACVTA